MRVRIVGALLVALASVSLPASNASVGSSPSINLDAALTSSLGTSSPTTWNDLATGTLQFTIGANSTYSSFGGGSLTNTSAGTSGAYLAPTTIGSASNPSSDISVFTWVYFTSWNTDWNILASRWFQNFGGTGSASDFHFAVRTKSTNHRLNLYTTSSTDIDGSTDLSLNKWYLLGFTLGSGTLKFYVNGKYDTPTVTSGITRTPLTTTYLFVGDYRTTCTACSFNGYMSKFRMWNSVLSPATIQADYRSEAGALGYSTTTTLALGNISPKYRISNSIIATVPSAGKITFYEKGKAIPRCKNLVVASTTGTCTWKPSAHGTTTVSASYTPTDTDFLTSTATQNYVVPARTTTR